MFRVLFLLLTVSWLIGTSSFAPAQESEFEPLFNGQDLDGWVQAGGKAIYRVKEGTIVGESVADTPNSFLCTKQLFDNFILEYEYKCDNLLNSGVQIRSNVYAIDTQVKRSGKPIRVPAGRVHGYQVEIDPNNPDRMWSGGIYDEARRGWLFPGLAGGDAKSFTAAGQTCFKPDQWNRVRVECNGARIRTWLNGQLRADFEDNLTPKGIIALQVHGIGGNQEAIGKSVMWRNIQIKEL